MLTQAIHNFEKTFCSTLGRAKVLIAVSGGMDSMVLLELCMKAKLNCAVAHVNFGLRGKESDADEALVKQICTANKIPFFSTHPKTKKVAVQKELSIQMAARELRYEFFESLIKNEGYEYVLTAHHANDNIEHLFIYLLRNNHSTAFKGIPAVRLPYLRPLLGYGRNEIQEYAMENNVQWREDASNTSTHYLRNKIRHLIVPGLLNEFPGILQEFHQISHELQTRARLQEDRDEELINHKLVHKKSYTSIPKELFKSQQGLRAITSYLRTQGFTLSQIEGMPTAQNGAVFESLLRDLVVEAEDFKLLNGRFTIYDYFLQLFSPPQSIQNIKAGGFEITIEPAWSEEMLDLPNYWYFDADKLKYPLQFRNRRTGDLMQPMGMVGHKKISDIFINHKIGMTQKDRYPIVESPSGILGVIGVKRSSVARVDSGTKTVLCMHWIPTEEFDEIL